MPLWSGLPGRIAIGIALTLAPALASGQGRLPDLSIEDLLKVTIQPVFGASDRLQPVTEAPASVTIITADDIKRYGYRTLADILRGVRGLYVTDDRNYSYLGVRGFSRPGDYNTRVLLLINSHRVNDNVYDQAYVGAELALDVALFDRVEVIRGPASSLYGTSAFLAVVNVITASGATMAGGKLAVDAGTLGTAMVRGTAGHEFATGVRVVASATYEGSRGVRQLFFPAYDTPETNSGIAEDLDGERMRSLYGQVTWRALTLTMTHGVRRRDIPTASYATLFNSQQPRERTTDRHTMLHAAFDRMAGATRIVADLSYDRLTYTGVYPYAGESSSAPAVTNYDDAVGTRVGAGLKATRALTGRQTLTVGAELLSNLRQKQESYYDDPLRESFVVDEDSHYGALYVQDEIKIRPWLLLNAGLRHDRHERFARTSPRAAVIVLPSANVSFKYLYGRAFRAPNAYELSYYGDASARLRPESIATHELVWEYYGGEWLRTSVSAYRSVASHLIALRAEDKNPDQLGFINEGTARGKGLELEGEVRTKGGLSAVGSVVAQNTVDEFSTRLTNSPRVVATLRLSGPIPLARSFASVEVQHLGQRRSLADTTIGAVTVAHVTFTARLTNAIEVVGTVRNLLNQRYADPASAEHSFDSIQQNGRTARIGVRWALWAR